MRIIHFQWLFLIPFWQILSGNEILLVSSQCLDDQKSLLLQLKGSLQYDSSLSNKLARWNKNTSDCCKWDGVTCDSSGHVINLELDNEAISGGIENSSALFSLLYLEKLNLAYNRFNVGIPVGIDNLTNLKYLNLSDAGFVGQIPMTLSRLSRLVTLDLTTLYSLAVGIQPLKLENPNLRHFIENLTEVRELYLDGVDLSAQASEWCQSLSSYLPNLTNLSLRACRISGPIDESLSKLQFLSVIRLDQNNLSTTVPEYFANFTNLTTLTLGSCNLQGVFPEKIFQIQALETLALSNNKLLSGRIPSTIANLTNLVYLDFSSNNFTGSIPYFQRSKKLSYLDLSHNGLTGHLSSDHFEGLSELVYINIGNNLLNGILPAYIFELPSLQQLFLNGNQFVGQVKEFRNASSSLLDTIDLSNNHLNGSIPNSIFGVERLKVLSLSSNLFSGRMSLDLIGRLSNLSRLELSYNNLTIDTSSSNLTSFTFPQLSILNLACCRLQKFPELKNLRSLGQLDLSDNQIQGPIPNWIWEIGDGALSHLNLSCNQLEYLEQPYNVSSNLVVLDLHSNRLKGDLPIPPSFAIYVDYSKNNFSSSIPLHIGNALCLGFFSLANNRLTGIIPESICNASYLQVLDFSNNALSGAIPPCLLENVTNLGVLNLGNNKLHGVIPDAFPIGSSLQTLDLSENKLQGRLPKSLINCDLLEVLNVGNNRLVDSFPSMMKNSSSLRVLVLRSNGFYGDFQCDVTSHCWKKIQIIDIASNKFTGELTAECLSNWKGMMVQDDYIESGLNHIQFKFLQLNNLYYQDTVTITNKGMEMKLVKILRVYTSIDFSSNRFQGVIPDMVGNLSALYVLNLSHNTLEEPIPKSIGKLQMLGSLDLSSNQLSGEIPVELAHITFLAFLNLSFNKLFGRIPSINQFLTFSAASFEGNDGLCGLPLKNCKSNDSEVILPPISLEDSDFDWKFIFAAVGYAVGAANTVALLWFYEPVKIWFDIRMEKCLLWFSTM
ncbi:PREDICTED: receptor-like protein 12 [Nicotiana attenuata]|uniref:Receptor-like protein 12 n=1 Tax=Nicotiana attenuata TaxID=49451 RepID=A0A1J6IKD6_NICAT|nr:PREDICTED: receptor-like protein 12 [Nicotiana attenuata]OIT00992.1 receptor-like protein 12 [Nicotiana attenuata]